jgi:hypothetical protein
MVGGLCMESGILDRIFCGRKVVPLYLAHFSLILLGFCSRFGNPYVT